MPILFAHHGMLDRLDVLGLHPTSTGEHAVAFALYLLLILGVAFAARAASGWCRTALVSRKGRLGEHGAEALAVAEPRL